MAVNVVPCTIDTGDTTWILCVSLSFSLSLSHFWWLSIRATCDSSPHPRCAARPEGHGQGVVRQMRMRCRNCTASSSRFVTPLRTRAHTHVTMRTLWCATPSRSVSTTLVLGMCPGLAFFEAGMLRSKNTLSVRVRRLSRTLARSPSPPPYQEREQAIFKPGEMLNGTFGRSSTRFLQATSFSR